VETLPQGYCHGDLHRGNLLLGEDGTLSLLDFDTSCRAPVMFDIAVMCDATDYFRFFPEGMRRSAVALERFLCGYERRSSISSEESAAFYDWIALRHFQLQATIVEIYGLDCIGEAFADTQLDWLRQWLRQCRG
jgi:Ser/Thr protein kinase RdoA (MazF antagonist)